MDDEAEFERLSAAVTAVADATTLEATRNLSRGEGRYVVPRLSAAEESRRKAEMLRVMGERHISAIRAARLLGIALEHHILWCKTDPTYSMLIAEKEESHIHVLVDSLTDLHDTLDDAKLAQVAASNIKWYASRKAPQHYGDKVVADQARQELTDIIREGLARVEQAVLSGVRPGQSGPLLDHEARKPKP